MQKILFIEGAFCVFLQIFKKSGIFAANPLTNLRYCANLLLAEF